MEGIKKPLGRGKQHGLTCFEVVIVEGAYLLLGWVEAFGLELLIVYTVSDGFSG